MRSSPSDPAAVVAIDRCRDDHVDAGRARDAVERLPAEAVFQALAETFRVLADPGRVRLISVLLEAGELCVCELACATGLSETACSHNLRVLRFSRLVRYRRRGRNVLYALDDEHIHQLLAVAFEHVGHADAMPALQTIGRSSA